MKKRKKHKECLYNSISATTPPPEGCNSIISRVLNAMDFDKNLPSYTESSSRHPEETQCPKDLRVSKEILARDKNSIQND